MDNQYERRAKEILRRQFRIHMSESARARQDRYWALAERCESPIEQLLLAPLMFISPRCIHPRYDGPGDLPFEAKLHVQHQVGPYRLDFAYIVTPHKEREGPIRIAIECDGQEHHSSREQRERDSARQNDLLGYGFTTLRYTGSQIHADPEAVVQEISDAVDRIYAKRIHDLTANHNNNDEDAA